jgi:hypothetical protein
MSIILFVFEPCLLFCVIFIMSYLYVLVPGKFPTDKNWKRTNLSVKKQKQVKIKRINLSVKK